MAQNGPGITNFVTAVAAAYWAHSPVVVVTPEAGTMTQGLGGFQEAQQLSIFESITKYQAHVNNPRRMAEFTARAFDRAMLQMGPTQLNIPRDFFYGDFDYEIPAPVRVEHGPGGTESLDEAAKKIAAAKFPVIISGGGVVQSDGIQEVVQLAELLGAPVLNSYLHNDSFPASHRLWCGPLGYQGSRAAMKLIADADVVIALGTRLGPFGTLPQYGLDYWPRNAEVIQVDADPQMLGLVKKVAVGICGDAKAAAQALCARLQKLELASRANASDRGKRIAAEKASWEQQLDEWLHERDPYSLDMIREEPNLIHPRQVLRELEKAMPSNAMVSTDIGNICSVSNSYLRFEQPRSMLAAMSFGNCGYAFPCAIGAKVGRPDRPAVAYAGDGAWGMSFGELLTCVRENIPTTAVVFNNRQWGAEKKNQVDFYDRRFLGVDLENPSFAGIARAMGAAGVRIEHLDEVGDALASATRAQDEGKTTVIEIMVSRELGDPFRRDALSKPVRFLEHNKAYV
jgi:sulfoacetaldehyde acetyltransferase